MTTEEVVEYRKHTLVARATKGNFNGRVYDPSRAKMTDIQGSSLEEVMVSLKDIVDTTIANQVKGRSTPPTSTEYVRAFQNIIGDLPESYTAMLKAHYHAPNRTLTATQLAEAGHYKNWSSANLHYGLLGKRVYEELPIQLPTRDDGTMIYTFALATGDNLKQDEAQWQWKLRPEVAEAIEYLGLLQ
jgi:hypothetical protein